MIVIINGAPGAGKTYLLDHLHSIEGYSFSPIKKHTTRHERKFEIDKNSQDLVYGCSLEGIQAMKYHYMNIHGESYGIPEEDIQRELEKGNIPVIIIRDFQTIREIKNDYKEVKVFMVIGASGPTLKKKLKDQRGRDIESAENDQRVLLEEYINNVELVDNCIINSLYDNDLYINQLTRFTFLE